MKQFEDPCSDTSSLNLAMKDAIPDSVANSMTLLKCFIGSARPKGPVTKARNFRPKRHWTSFFEKPFPPWTNISSSDVGSEFQDTTINGWFCKNEKQLMPGTYKKTYWPAWTWTGRLRDIRSRTAFRLKAGVLECFMGANCIVPRRQSSVISCPMAAAPNKKPIASIIIFAVKLLSDTWIQVATMAPADRSWCNRKKTSKSQLLNGGIVMNAHAAVLVKAYLVLVCREKANCGNP